MQYVGEELENEVTAGGIADEGEVFGRDSRVDEMVYGRSRFAKGRRESGFGVES